MRVGAREAVQQDSGETGVVREGVGDDVRLVFRTSEVPGVAGVLAVLAVFAGGIPELGDDRTTVLRCGSGGLGALGVGQLQHAGADREPSRGLGEHRRGQGPGRCGAGGDQREAHHRPRQCEPPRSPARHPPGAPSQQRRHGEGEDDRRAGQHRHHLPAQPEHAEHRPGPHDDDRRRGDGERPRSRSGSHRARTSATAPGTRRSSPGDNCRCALIAFTSPWSRPSGIVASPSGRVGPAT